MFKQLFQRYKLMLAAALFVACLVGSASAWKISHVHSAAGQSDSTTAFEAAYTGYYYTGGKAPSNGGLSTAIKLNDVEQASCQTAHGGVCCDAAVLTDDVDYDFYSFAHVFSGVGKAYVWDKNEPAQPVTCPEEMPN